MHEKLTTMPDNKQSENLLQPEELNPAVELTEKVLAELDHVLLGRSALHRMVLIGILSQGHILLEGVPGVGKTALVKALGNCSTSILIGYSLPPT